MLTNKTSDKKDSSGSQSANGTTKLEIETRNNVLKVAEIEAAQKANRTVGEKVAEIIASFCGSMVFVYVHIVWFGGWILLNSIPRFQFDAFPFTFLTLVVSLEAIFLSTFILISQNHETKLTEHRNHLDLQINMLAEQENTKTLELLHLIAVKVGVTYDDASTEALLEPVEPGLLVKQIIDARAEDIEKAKGSKPATT